MEKVGKSVTHLRPGDRVWTSTYYRDVRAGCFQEYVVVPEHTALPIPGGLSYEEAACLGVAALTACITLWRWLQVPQPRPTTAKHFSSSYRDLGKQPCDEEGWFLIWGGSSITGQFAVQLAKLSGLKVVVVCSTQSVGLCQSLGADGVVTRDNKEVAEIMAELTDITRGCITRALDLVGPETASYCLQVCSATQQREQLGQKKVLFAPLAMMRSSEPVPNTVEVLTVEMKQFVLNASFRRYAQTLNEFLETGQLRLPSLSILDGGLEAVETGLELVKSGKMNGTRVIVRVP